MKRKIIVQQPIITASSSSSFFSIIRGGSALSPSNTRLSPLQQRRAVSACRRRPRARSTSPLVIPGSLTSSPRRPLFVVAEDCSPSSGDPAGFSPPLQSRCSGDEVSPKTVMFVSCARNGSPLSSTPGAPSSLCAHPQSSACGREAAQKPPLPTPRAPPCLREAPPRLPIAAGPLRGPPPSVSAGAGAAASPPGPSRLLSGRARRTRATPARRLRLRCCSAGSPWSASTSRRTRPRARRTGAGTRGP